MNEWSIDSALFFPYVLHDDLDLGRVLLIVDNELGLVLSFFTFVQFHETIKDRDEIGREVIDIKTELERPNLFHLIGILKNRTTINL